MPLKLSVDRPIAGDDCRTIDVEAVLDAAKARGVRRLHVALGGLVIEAEFGEPPPVPLELPPDVGPVDTEDLSALASGLRAPTVEEIKEMRRKRGGL